MFSRNKTYKELEREKNKYLKSGLDIDRLWLGDAVLN